MLILADKLTELRLTLINFCIVHFRRWQVWTPWGSAISRSVYCSDNVFGDSAPASFRLSNDYWMASIGFGLAMFTFYFKDTNSLTGTHRPSNGWSVPTDSWRWYFASNQFFPTPDHIINCIILHWFKAWKTGKTMLFQLFWGNTRDLNLSTMRNPLTHYASGSRCHEPELNRWPSSCRVDTVPLTHCGKGSRKTNHHNN